MASDIGGATANFAAAWRQLVPDATVPSSPEEARRTLERLQGSEAALTALARVDSWSDVRDILETRRVSPQAPPPGAREQPTRESDGGPVARAGLAPVRAGATALQGPGLARALHARIGPERVTLFELEDVRRPNGAIGTQGVSSDRVRVLMNAVLGQSFASDVSMRTMVDVFKNDRGLQQALLAFTEEHPLNVFELPDGTFHLQDGNHRAFLFDQAGIAWVPATIREQGAYSEKYRER